MSRGSMIAVVSNLKIDGSTAGPAAGTSKGVMFTTSSDREDKGEFLGHFFKQIDKGVNEVLRGESKPLVLAAVEYELALYRTTNKYPHIAAESVEGAPNSLKSGEMHARALDALERCYEKKVDQALGEYNHLVGVGASNRLKDIVTASHEGRVLTLLVSDSLETTGSFNESTHSVKGRETGGPKDEDLVNDAVVRLEGMVRLRRMKHAIEDIAADCSGVEDVQNHIRVEQR